MRLQWSLWADGGRWSCRAALRINLQKSKSSQQRCWWRPSPPYWQLQPCLWVSGRLWTRTRTQESELKLTVCVCVCVFQVSHTLWHYGRACLYYYRMKIRTSETEQLTSPATYQPIYTTQVHTHTHTHTHTRIKRTLWVQCKWGSVDSLCAVTLNTID